MHSAGVDSFIDDQDARDGVAIRGWNYGDPVPAYMEGLEVTNNAPCPYLASHGGCANCRFQIGGVNEPPARVLAELCRNAARRSVRCDAQGVLAWHGNGGEAVHAQHAWREAEARAWAVGMQADAVAFREAHAIRDAQAIRDAMAEMETQEY